MENLNIHLRHAHVRELIVDGVLTIIYVKLNPSDPLTKGLLSYMFRITSYKMGLKSI